MELFNPQIIKMRSREFTPLYVQIEMTWRCNWRCVHCYQDDHTLQVLTSERLLDLFQELSDCGTMHLIVTGGEPLVRRDIYNILRHIRSHGMAITLYSNGHLIDTPAADKLQELVGIVEISILAGDETTHDMLTKVRGSFRKTMQAISLLKERGIGIVVKTPILKHAYHTLKILEKRMQDMGVTWQVDPEISHSYAGEEFPLQFKLNNQELHQFFLDFPQFNPQVNFSAGSDVRQGLCLAARNFCFIDALGNVYPCLNFKSVNYAKQTNRQVAEVVMGNIMRESFINIWKFSSFAQRIREATFTKFTICGECKANVGCRQCMALNYEQHGELFRPSRIVCDLTKAAASVYNHDFIPASETKGFTEPVLS